MTVLSAPATEWLESTLHERIVHAEPLVGGMSSDVYLVRTASRDPYVLRHISDEDWRRREPDLIRNEALVLRLLEGFEVSAPRHIGSAPALGLLAMSYLPGRVETSPVGLRNRTRALAQIAVSIAEVSTDERFALPEWRPWVPDEPGPPEWGTRSLWEEAIDAFRTGRPAVVSEPVLLHRDLHPLNILWTDGGRPGVVDWVNACVGHPHAELGHCRWNLAVLGGQPAADSFLDHYLALSGDARYDPWWDIAPVLSFLPGPIGVSGWQAVGREDLTEQVVVEATERFLRLAVDRASS